MIGKLFMKNENILFKCIFINMCIIFFYTFFVMFSSSDIIITERHITIDGMNNALNSNKYFEEVSVYALFLQILVLIFYGSLMAVTVIKKNNNLVLFYIAFATFLGIINWLAMYFTYQNYLNSGLTEIFFGFPLATNFMVYGNWLTGILFASIYIYFFNDVIYSNEDEQAFKALLNKYKKK